MTNSQFRRALLDSACGDAPAVLAKLRAWDALQEAKRSLDRASGRYNIVEPRERGK